MSNGRIARVLAKVRATNQLGYLRSVNEVSDSYTTVGLVAAAKLVDKTFRECAASDHALVEQRMLNTLIPKLVSHGSLLPGNLAVSVFNNLVSVDDPRARIILADIQDRWFEGWRESALEKSTKRPKKKLDTVGLYSSELRGIRSTRIPRCPFIESLNDETLERAVHNMAALHEKDPRSTEYIALIVRAFLKEFRQRKERSGTEISEPINEFILQLDKHS